MPKDEATTSSSSAKVARRRSSGRRSTKRSSTKGNGAKRNGAKRNGAKRNRAPAPPVPIGEEHSGSIASETGLRFQLASLLRISDNIVSRAVTAYDSLFALERKEQAEVYLEMGKELAARGKAEQALEALRKAIRLRSGYSEALMEVGLVNLRRRAPEAAVRAFEEAREVGGTSYLLHKSLADALMMQDKDDEALAEIECAVRLEPKVAEDHYRLGVALDRVGRYEGAVQAFGRAIELAPHEVAYHQSLGFTLESMGRRRDAIKCFKRALQLERPAGATNDVTRR